MKKYIKDHKKKRLNKDCVNIRDFYITEDDYRYRFDMEAKKRFLGLLKDRFNSGIRYKGKNWKWDTIILNKTQELAQFIKERWESFNHFDLNE